MTMSGIVLKLNLDRCKVTPTNFGWEYIKIIERYLFRTTIRRHVDGCEMHVPEYYLWILGYHIDIDGKKNHQLCSISEDDLEEELCYGNYNYHSQEKN